MGNKRYISYHGSDVQVKRKVLGTKHAGSADAEDGKRPDGEIYVNDEINDNGWTRAASGSSAQGGFPR